MTPKTPPATDARNPQATVLPPLRPIVSSLLRSKTGPLLIVLQVALTLAILCNALFIAQQRLHTAALPSGIPEAELFHVEMVTPGYEETPFDLQRRDEALVRAVPGVLGASWASQVPLHNSGNNSGVAAQRGPQAPQYNAAIYRGGAALLDTLGLRLLAGRTFTEAEVLDSDRRESKTEAHLVIVSAALAARLFPGVAPDGVVGRPVFPGTGDDEPAFTVVGVVERLVSPWGPAAWNPGDPEGQHSLLLPSRTEQAGHLVVRASAAEREAVRQRVLSALRQAAPGRVIVAHAGLDELRSKRFADDTWLAGQMAVAIALLLLMTAGGIVALASLWVTQRRRQIGVRRALGARRRDIVSYFMAENLMITAAGTLLGLTLALALNQLLVRAAGLQPLPGPLLATGAGVMLLLGLLAVLAPALRAANLPPAEATRSA
jgi:putative ABC transport system permease protein